MDNRVERRVCRKRLPAGSCSLQQVENISAQLRRLVIPMAVNLPVRSGERVLMPFGPIADCLVSLGESVVRSKVGSCENATRRRRRADHRPAAAEGFGNFHTDFKVNLAVPINRDMTTSLDLQRFK